MGFQENLFEKLKFNFYSNKEAEIISVPEISTTSVPEEQEMGQVGYDPFSSSVMNINKAAELTNNKNEMIQKWRASSYQAKVDSALNEICSEAIVFDEIEPPIKINLTEIELPDTIKDTIEESFQNILYMLDFNKKGIELFRQWYVDGQLNFEVVYDNNRIRDGIKKIILLSPFNFNSYYDVKTGTTKYYFGDINSNKHKLQSDSKEDRVFLEEQITHINSGYWSMDRKFPISKLNKAMKPINQLNLIEDSLVLARITKATEKRAFYIPTGKLNKAQAEEYIRSVISRYRQKRVYNIDSGTVENRSRTISVLEDFFFPVGADGQGPRVENIAGTAPGFTSFEDVDMFVNEVYTALGVPLNRRNKDNRITQGNQIDIEKDELKFFKQIIQERRKFNELFVDLLKKDLLAKNVLKIQDWILIQEKINFIYSSSNEYSEIKNNQIITMRVEAANAATQLVDNGYYSKKWVQKNILRLTDEDIQEIDNDNAIANGESLDKEAANTFGDGYTAIPRSNRSFTNKPEPKMEEPSDLEQTTPEPETKPTEGGAVENVMLKNDNLLVEKLNPMILSNLEEGDIITNGEIQLKYTNGKLEKI